MQVAVLELPQEGIFKVTLDDTTIDGYLKRNVTNDRFEVYMRQDDGHTRALKMQPRSREAAAMLLAYYHLENERKRIQAQQKAQDEAMAAVAPPEDEVEKGGE